MTLLLFVFNRGCTTIGGRLQARQLLYFASFSSSLLAYTYDTAKTPKSKTGTAVADSVWFMVMCANVADTNVSANPK